MRRGAGQVRGVAGFVQLAPPTDFAAQPQRPLVRALVIPGLRLQPGADDRTRLLAGVGGLPLRLEHREVARYLAGALAHHRVERPQLRHLPGDRIERQAMRVQHRGELRVGRQHRGAERADGALLPEQRRSVQPAPGGARPDASPDLEVNVPMRIAGPGGLVREAYCL